MYNEIISLLKKISTIRNVESSNNEEINKTVVNLKTLYAKIQKVVIVKLDAIGDWILFYNSYVKIKNLFPNAKVSLIIYEDVKETIVNYKDIDEYLTIERKLFNENKAYREELLAYLYSTDYDLLINPLFSREFSADLICQFINAKLKIGIDGDKSNILSNISKHTDLWYDYLLCVDKSSVKFELIRNQEMIELLGCTHKEICLPEIPIREKDKNTIKEFLKENILENYVLLFPGSRGGERSVKFWDIEKFAMLIDYFHEKNIAVVVLGGEDEESICFSIASKSKKRPIVLVNHFNIWQSAELIRQSMLYVGTDTSMAHISSALNIPTVVLLGGGHFGRFFPYPDNNKVISVFIKMECYNCNWKCIKEKSECIKNIQVVDVIRACEKFILNVNNTNEYNQKKSASFVKHVGSGPKIDLLFPSGNHSWHLKEGIINSLSKSHLLNKAFVLNQYNCSSFFEYVAKGVNSDIIFALGGDHHLWFLYNTREKKLFWDTIKIAKVCYSYESTLDSIYPEYKQRAEASYEIFSHFLYSDEVDANLFESRNLNSMYFPQFADETTFHNKKPFLERKRKIMFCGKLWAEYSERKRIINVLTEAGLCDNFSSIKTFDLISLYNKYGITINPSGVLGGFNVRTFETLATGSVLLQYKHANRPINNSMFVDKKHLLYFGSKDIDNLGRIAKDIVENYGDYAKIASEGHAEFIANHTTKIRMEKMIDWVSNTNDKDSGKAGVVSDNDKLKSKIISSDDLSPILLSAIVSTYNSESFIKGCLQDLVDQTLFKKQQMEIIVVNSASTEGEEGIVKQFKEKYNNIEYICTNEREGIYSSWNRAIKKSRGKYITNANTDDRHSLAALEKLTDFLEHNCEYDIVYANDMQTSISNDVFESGSTKSQMNWSEYDKDLLLFGCYIGPHPVWRKSLHDKYGLFDEALQVVGDYEFWLRVSKGAKFFHLNETLGLYYYSGQSAEHRDPNLTDREHKAVQRNYIIECLKSEADIKHIQIKLDHLRKVILNTKYFDDAFKLVDMRHRGIKVQNQIKEFSNNSHLLDDPMFLYKVDQFIKVIENDEILLDSALFYGILNSLKGIYYLKLQDPENAKESFIQSLMHDPSNQTSVQGLKNIFGKNTELFVHYMLSIADELLYQKKLKQAKALLKKVLEYDFYNLDALNNLAVVEILNNNFDLATDFIEKVLKIDPDNELAMNNLNYMKHLLA